MELDMLEALRVTTEAISQIIPNDMQEVNGKLHLSRDGKSFSEGISVNADTLDGKHADEFVVAVDFNNLVGDIPVAEQIEVAIRDENLDKYATIESLSQFVTTESLDITNGNVEANAGDIIELKTLVGDTPIPEQISDALDNLALGDTYAGKEHAHEIADIAGLEAAINNKAPQVIPLGADFDTYLEIDNYVGQTTLGDGAVANYVHAPSVTKASFRLSVLPTGSSGQIMQRLTLCSKGYGRTWERHYHSGSWGEWYCVYADRNTVLWSGAEQMGANEDGTLKAIELAEPIYAQPTGIVLVFSYNSTDTSLGAQNYQFHTFFHSKYEIATHPGAGRSYFLCSSGFTILATKYLYINDLKITGNADNTKSGTSSTTGLSYNNERYVLRYVIGV